MFNLIYYIYIYILPVRNVAATCRQHRRDVAATTEDVTETRKTPRRRCHD